MAAQRTHSFDLSPDFSGRVRQIAAEHDRPVEALHELQWRGHDLFACFRAGA